MYWTLQVMTGLCVACALLNAVQWIMARSVRAVGILVCGAWAIQQ